MDIRNIFDNTKSVRDFARTAEAEKILSVPKGKEEKLFDVGDIVSTTEDCPYNLDSGKIVSFYNDNGYYYYEVEFLVGKRKKNTKTFKTRHLVRKEEK